MVPVGGENGSTGMNAFLLVCNAFYIESCFAVLYGPVSGAFWTLLEGMQCV